MKFGHIVFEICELTSMLIAILRIATGSGVITVYHVFNPIDTMQFQLHLHGDCENSLISVRHNTTSYFD